MSELIENADLMFLASAYETFEIPKEKKYLLRYFTTPVQQTYLKYVFLCGNRNNFVEHTGFNCQERWLKILDKKLEKLLIAHKEAKSNMDLSLLAKIEKGKYRI